MYIFFYGYGSNLVRFTMLYILNRKQGSEKMKAILEGSWFLGKIIGLKGQTEVYECKIYLSNQRE